MCHYNTKQKLIVNDIIFPNGFIAGSYCNTTLRSFVKSIGRLIWCIQKRSHSSKEILVPEISKRAYPRL